MSRIIVAAIALCAAAAAPAQTISIENSNASVKPPPLPENNLEQVVCERVVRTGSRLAIDKVCLTVAEWKEKRDVQRWDFERVQRVVNQEPSDLAGYTR
ncbi:hypothetical protein GCM10022276_12550 [Sphingomonas limnosediminicola]|uniref:UrcA family protein n=1 Tax=Sphingomonas limnosediminicola TaxID=940133 RepID=A0ABP7L5Y3_9SPHN